MAQWQDCGLSAGRHGVQSSIQAGRVGVRFLYKLGQPPKTFISYSLLSVAQIGRDYFEVFHYSILIIVHAIYVVCIYTKKLSFLHVWASLKQREVNPHHDSISKADPLCLRTIWVAVEYHLRDAIGFTESFQQCIINTNLFKQTNKDTQKREDIMGI